MTTHSAILVGLWWLQIIQVTWMIWIGAKEEPLKGTTPSAAPKTPTNEFMNQTNISNYHVRSAMQADISFTIQGLGEAFLDHPCPQSGDPNGGVNDWWLPSTSRRCQIAGLTENEAYDRLRDGSADCGRRVTDKEIWRAVSWIYSTPLPDGLSRETKPKIRANDELIEAITSDPRAPGLYDLWEASPVKLADRRYTGSILSKLYRPDDLICIGVTEWDFITLPLSELPDSRCMLSAPQYIVPTPMRALKGWTKDEPSKLSYKSDDNAGENWMYFDAEFDRRSQDEQAALIAHLSTYAPLVMVVWSGGKSLHGWFRLYGEPEDKAQRFIDYALSLGADSKMNKKSQFGRMPDGMRDNGERQSVIYFNPEMAVTK
jgi:hypothetical protein